VSQGEKGDTGDQGLMGSRGPTGVTGEVGDLVSLCVFSFYCWWHGMSRLPTHWILPLLEFFVIMLLLLWLFVVIDRVFLVSTAQTGWMVEMGYQAVTVKRDNRWGERRQSWQIL